jgi:competence protein ComEC
VQAVVALLALAGFVVLARPSTSLVRAAAVGAVTLLALASVSSFLGPIASGAQVTAAGAWAAR